MGHGQAWHDVLDGPARHKNRPVGHALGRRLGTKSIEARRLVMARQSVAWHDIGPARHGPLDISRPSQRCCRARRRHGRHAAARGPSVVAISGGAATRRAVATATGAGGSYGLDPHAAVAVAEHAAHVK
jgi:hypothetical protein